MNDRVLKSVGWSLVLALTLGLGIFIGREFVPAQVFAQSEAPASTPKTALLQADEVEPGILIAGIVSDSPAAEAGLARGDILLEVNGEAVNHVFELREKLVALQSGDAVSLTVLHGDDERTLTATLTERNGLAYLGVRPCEAGPMMGAAFGPSMAFSLKADTIAPGAGVVDVEADSPAEAAGLQPGDRITAVDGEALGQSRSLVEIVAGHQPGDSLALEIERQGEAPQTITVTLGEKPDQAGKAYLGVRLGPSFAVHAMRPEDFSPGMPYWHEFPADMAERAVVIQRVTADSPAAQAGLAQGDTITAIDSEAVTEPGAVVEIVKAHQPGDSLTLTVKKAGQEDETTVAVTLAEDPNQADTAFLGVSLGILIHIAGKNGEDTVIFEAVPGPHWEAGERVPGFNEFKIEPLITGTMTLPVPGDMQLIWSDDGSL